MASAICFVGTCQAMALHSIYNQYIREEGEDEALYFSSNIPMNANTQEIISKCDIVVNQRFSSAQQIGQLCAAEGQTIIEFPYMAGLFLWPYATEGHINRRFIPTAGFAPYDEELGDKFLNKLISRGLTPEQCLSAYHETDVIKTAHVERRWELLSEQQQARDEATGVPALKFIQMHISSEELFMTRGHLSKPSLMFLVREVFGRLKISDATISTIDRLMFRVPDHRNYAPIHPAIADFFQLTYARRSRKYEQFYGAYDFDDCVRRYVNYEWNQPLVEGMQAEERGQHSVAIDLISKNLQTTEMAHYPYPSHSLGRALKASGKLASALACFEAAIAGRQDDPYLYISLSEQYRQLHATEDARATLEAAEKVFPGYPAVYEAKSHLLISHNDVDGSIEAAEIALSASRKKAPLQIHLSGLYLRKGLLTKAQALLEDAIKSEPQNANAWRMLAEANLRLGEPNLAKYYVERSLALDGSHLGSLYIYASILKSTSKLNEAIETYRSIAELRPNDAHAFEELSHLLLKLDDVDGAIECAKTAARLRPENVTTSRHLSGLLSLKGDARASLNTLLSVLEFAPRDPDIHLRIGKAFQALGQQEAAAYALTNVLALAPDNIDAQRQLAPVRA